MASKYRDWESINPVRALQAPQGIIPAIYAPLQTFPQVKCQ